MENIRCLERETALAQVRNLVHKIPEIGLDAIVHIIQNLSPVQRCEVAKVIGRPEVPAGPSNAATCPASPSGSGTTASGASTAPEEDVVDPADSL